jgi:hypothetical protein
MTDRAFSWKVHPLADEPWLKSAALVLLVCAVSAAAGLSFEGWLYGAVSLAALAASLSRYLLPTHYALDESQLRIRHLGRQQQRPWQQCRRADVHDDGVFLSPFARPHRLDPFRGCFLRFGRNRDAVLRFVREHVPADSA